MKNGIRFLSCLIILQFFGMPILHAQDLTGIWRGHFRSNDGLERLAGNYDDRYKIEVQIAQTRNRLEAVTYSYKNSEFYGKADATGSLNIQSKKVLLKEGKLLEVRYASGSVCVMTCFLQYSKLGNDEYLQGTYYSSNVNDSTAGCGKGSIFLHRVAASDFHKEPFLEKKESELLARKKEKEPEVKPTSPPPPPQPPVALKTEKAKQVPASPPPVVSKKESVKQIPAGTSAPVAKKNTEVPVSAARKKSSDFQTQPSQYTRDSSIELSEQSIRLPVPAVLKTRSNEILKTITVNNSSIELRIYDDGAIDNDTVSVYYDNKLIISRARLTDQAITFHITVEPSDEPHRLVMVAENLGEIPPNTSLLVVRDGEKRYEERIISTEQKNVEINFVFKKIE